MTAANEEKRLPQEGECWLPTSGYCCCQCQWLAEDRSHPHTDGKRCIERRGFVCLSPELKEGNIYVVFSGWPEHSGSCEMFAWRERETEERVKNSISTYAEFLAEMVKAVSRRKAERG